MIAPPEALAGTDFDSRDYEARALQGLMVMYVRAEVHLRIPFLVETVCQALDYIEVRRIAVYESNG